MQRRGQLALVLFSALAQAVDEVLAHELVAGDAVVVECVGQIHDAIVTKVVGVNGVEEVGSFL